MSFLTKRKPSALSKHIIYGLLIAATLLLASCGDQPYGIFAEIEREADAEDSAFFGANLRGMARVDRGGAEYYIVASGRPKWRPADISNADADDWSNADRPSGFRGSGDWMISVVEVDDGTDHTTYGLFRDNDREKFAIFEWETGSGWAADPLRTQADFEGSDPRISRLFSANNELFASVRRSDSSSGSDYDIWHIDTGNGSTTKLGTGTNKPFSDAAHDDTRYWFVSRNAVYYTDDLNLDSLTGAPDKIFDPGIDDSPPYDQRGIYFDNANNNLYVSTGNSVYWVNIDDDDGTADADWEELPDNRRSDDRFTRFARFGDHIFVGSDRPTSGSGGIYRIELNGDGNPTELRRETGKPDGSFIYRSHVAEFYVPSGGSSLFALVFSSGDDNPGLWRRDDNADSDWSAE